MTKIVRTKTKVSGGITADEKRRMDEHTRLWISRAMRTNPIEPDKIIPAIEGLYAAAGLKKPRVVIVPSPLVMAFAYGASAAIWHRRGTDAATFAATHVATDAATRVATDAATDAATACHYLAGGLGIDCAAKWGNNYQGGNMWASYDCYLTAYRDGMGLRLPAHAA